MAPKSKPSKLPTRTVVADDLVIEVDGTEYRPHAGESVTFRAGHGASFDTYLFTMRVFALQADIDAAAKDGEVDLSRVRELEEIAGQALQGLADGIVSWTWTDNEGNAYPSPPTADALRRMHPSEVAWLRASLNPPRATPGEADGASTGSSTG